MTLLCGLADVQTYLGTTDNSTAAVIEQLIENASAFIERYCNRTFEVMPYTETRNGNNRARMMLNNAPIVAVSAVSIEGIVVPQSTGAQVPGWVADTHTLYLRAGSGFSIFPEGVQNVGVTYTAGFATVPPDVAQACIELIAFKLAKRNRIDKKNETLGQQQTIGFDTSDMPKSVATALASYQRFTVW